MIDSVDKLCKKIVKLDKGLSYERCENIGGSPYMSILYKDVEVYIITRMTVVAMGKETNFEPLYNEFKKMFTDLKHRIDNRSNGRVCFECRNVVDDRELHEGLYYGPGNWMCDECVKKR